MSDLISRKTLMDVFQEKADDNTGLLRNNMLFAKELVKSIPTAYDVDKVVEQLQQMKTRYFLTIANTGNETLDKIYEDVGNSIDKAISIVKGGGQGE